jgi:signal transduction histidine kinase
VNTRVSDAEAPKDSPTSRPSGNPSSKLALGVLGLSLLSCALVLGLVAYQAFRDRWERIEREKESIARMAESVAIDTGNIIERIRSFLETADYWLSLNPRADPRFDPAFAKLVDQFRTSMRGRVDIRLVSEDGGLFYIPSKSKVPLIDVRDRDYYKAQVAKPPRGFYIANPVLSRVTHVWGIPISHPVKTRNGGIAVVFAVVEMPVLEELYDKVRPKPNGSVLLVRGDGIILARAPFIDKLVGMPIREDIPAWRDSIAKTPVWTAKAATDDEDRIIAAKVLEDPDLVVSVSSKLGDVLAPWVASLWWRILIAALMVVAIATISSRLILVLRRLGDAQAELRSNMERLARSDATKDKLLSVIAHDLRGPIGGMASLLDTLSEDQEDLSPEELGELIEALRSASRNTSQLLENLLSWSRSQRGELPFVPERVLLLPIAEECAAVFELNAKEKGIGIRVSIESGLETRADPEQLKALLRNLLSNAVKFSPRGGRVDLEGSKTEGGILLTVRDEGVGMDGAQLEALFSPGAMRSRSGTANERGSGLGCILCKEIVDLHDGRIEVRSEVGKGSVFSVFLPSPD